MSDLASQWEQVYRRFDPEELGGARQTWRTERPKNPVPALIKRWRVSFAEEKYLLVGSVGSGKSTELRRIAESQPLNHFVVNIDIYHLFSNVLYDTGKLETLEIWEVLLLVGLGLYRAGSEYRFFGEGEQRALEEAATELQPGDAPIRLNVAKLAKAMAVGVVAAGTGAAAGSAAGPAGTILGALGGLVTHAAGATEALTMLEVGQESLDWNLPLGRFGKPAVQDREGRVQRLLQAVNRLIGKIQQQGWRVVLVVDGLDRIKHRSTAERLFTESALLSQLGCRVVMSGPLLLARDGMTTLVKGFTVMVLAEIPVISKDRFAADPLGVRFFQSLCRARTADLTIALPDPVVERLALYSGGVVREFVAMVRTLTIECTLRDLRAPDTAVIDEVIDERRRNIERGLHTNHLQLLQSILDDPEHRLPADVADATLDHLLTSFRLLPYPNQSEWYHPHPLLTLERLRLPGSPR